jgi:hypothetical protein
MGPILVFIINPDFKCATLFIKLSDSQWNVGLLVKGTEWLLREVKFIDTSGPGQIFLLILAAIQIPEVFG